MPPLPGLVCQDPPYAFLSSVTKELLAFRERVHNLGRMEGRHVWIDEVCHPKHVMPSDRLEIADELIRRIRQSRLYICVLGAPRHGSAIPIAGFDSAVSFFEVELFEAALGGVPIHIIVLDGFTPDPKLKFLLEILSFAVPRGSLAHTVSEASAIERIRRLLGAAARQVMPRILQMPVVRSLAQAFFDSRGGVAAQLSGTRPLLFVNPPLARSEAPRLAVIAEGLRLHRFQRDEQDRLTRLWIVLRELIGTLPPTDPQDPLFQYWNEALSGWADSASWYGLHAHLALSPLAAINSIASIRDNARAGSPACLPLLQHPGGQLATAWYSIGRKLIRGEARKAAFATAEAEIDQALGAGFSNRSNLFAIRGSVYRQQWRLSKAVADYEEVVKLRRADHADEGAIGEGLSELGFGYLCQGHLRKGTRYMEEGASLLVGSAIRTGFTARALRKLALGYFLTGRFQLGRTVKAQARQLAIGIHANDQVR